MYCPLEAHVVFQHYKLKAEGEVVIMVLKWTFLCVVVALFKVRKPSSVTDEQALEPACACLYVYTVHVANCVASVAELDENSICQLTLSLCS